MELLYSTCVALRTNPAYSLPAAYLVMM